MTACINSPTGQCQLTAPCKHACSLRVAPAKPMIGTVQINGMPYRREVMKVAKVTFDGATCVVPLHELGELIDGGEAYIVRVEVMPVREFERLQEFSGW